MSDTTSDQTPSYADIASHLPPQSDSEKRAPPPTQITPATSNARSSSLPDVDDPHVGSVPSDYASSSGTGAGVISLADNESSPNDESGQSSSKDKEKAKEEAKQKARDLSEKIQNKTNQNPIALSNMVLGGLLATALGVNVYQRWQSGTGFGARFVAGWVGVVLAVGAGDYAVSRWAGERGWGRK